MSMNVMNEFMFYVEKDRVYFKSYLMLEHALTEYYDSICIVNLLYSNC